LAEKALVKLTRRWRGGATRKARPVSLVSRRNAAFAEKDIVMENPTKTPNSCGQAVSHAYDVGEPKA
jgi:hypothetical protein